MQAETPEEGDIYEDDSVRWQHVPKPNHGYLVPIMTGYQRISELYAPGSIKPVRDAEIPFVFTEAVYGIGEWCGVHKIRTIEDIFWRYRTTDTGYYCQGAGAPVAFEHSN